jgi:cytoskeletal protein CcmA (bactofilin family)
VLGESGKASESTVTAAGIKRAGFWGSISKPAFFGDAMWNKRDEVPPAASGGRPTQVQQPRQEAGPPAPGVLREVPKEPVSSSVAAIGTSMIIKGDIFSAEELYVDGDVEGKLELNHRLTIGPRGKVRANIRAREVVVAGDVQGNVEASDKITIHKNGSLIGDIKTAGIVIDDGAYFKGSIDIVKSPSIKKPEAVKPEAVKPEAVKPEAAKAAQAS